MESSTMEDVITADFLRAKEFLQKRDFAMALSITEDSILVNGKDKYSAMLQLLQGSIFSTRAKETENKDIKSAFLSAAAESFRRCVDKVPVSLISIHSYANALFSVAQHFSLFSYYEVTVEIAKVGLSIEALEGLPDCCEDLSPGTSRDLNRQERIEKLKKDLEALIKFSEARMTPTAEPGTHFSSINNLNESSSGLATESLKFSKVRKTGTRNALAERLKSFWASMSIGSKRDFMKVSIEKLMCYTEEKYGGEAREALVRGLGLAKTNRKWKLWECPVCAKELHRSAECKKHLEQEHANKFRTPVKDLVPQHVDELWVRMVSFGDWEPVDIQAAVEMIKNQLTGLRKFVYVDGWSKDWPLTNDYNRRAVLKEIHQTLKSLLELKGLSCSIRDWIMELTGKQLTQLGVPRWYLDDSGLLNTPQCICFLKLGQLTQIRTIIGGIPTEITANLLCKALDGFQGHSRIKERINFDNEYSCLLLDRRLLRGRVVAFDDEGTIDVCGSSDHYARVIPQGDEIISWLFDCPAIDDEYMFRRPVRLRNLDIWLAFQRILETRVRALQQGYKKKGALIAYTASLTEIRGICMSEDGKRQKIPMSEWKSYACMLCDTCEERVSKDASSDATTIFLSAVRDLVEGSTASRCDFLESEVYMKQILEFKDVSDDCIAKTLKVLKVHVPVQALLMDSLILALECSRNQLLNDLTMLSMFDSRSLIIPLLKWFLRRELETMAETDAKARSVAAETALLAEIEQEVKKSPLPKKKKKDNKKLRKREDLKETPTSMPSPVDENPRAEPSITHESGPSKESGDFSGPELNTAEEEDVTLDVCPEDALSSESAQLRQKESPVSLGTEKQKETTAEGMQTTPYDPSRDDEGTSAHLASEPSEDAVVYNSALDMILKSLWHIRVFRNELVRCPEPVHNHAEDRCVICALRDLFSTFDTEQIDDEGLHGYLLNDLNLALQHTHPTANGSAFLLIAIFDFLHCWKSPCGGSLVNSIFTIEEFERMNCNRCRRKPNYPEQRSYGIVVNANTLREFKTEFVDLKFERILKAIRMNFQMFCDIGTGGCGKRNHIRHVLTRSPAVFTIALEWEKNETRAEIYETVAALETEIDISVLFKGVNPLAKYHLVSMVGGGEKEYSCMVCENSRWVGLGHHPNLKEEIGDWKDLLSFCRERKVRPEIMFFQASWWAEKLQVNVPEPLEGWVYPKRKKDSKQQQK